MGIKIKISKPKIKLPKAISKPVSSIVKGAGNIASRTVKAVSKGDVGGLTDTYVDALVDTGTGGNRKMVDGASGGMVSSLKGAYRGNSKDVTRLGVTGAAAIYGGPAGAAAANSFFAANGTKNLSGGAAAAFTSYQDPAGAAAGMVARALTIKRSPKSGGPELFSENVASGATQNIKKNKNYYIIGAIVALFFASILIIKKRKS